MKKIYISILLLTGLFLTFSAQAQIKIGTNGATIAPSSLLELESANQGLLLPRMVDTVAINALAPPNGMLIFLTKAPAVGLYVRKVTGWEYLTGSLGGNGNFNSLTVAGTVTAGSFSGPLNGNATSANTAINATNSANSTIINDISTSQPTYPTFVLATNGNSQLRTATTKLSFVPNTGILTATGFVGPLTGDVTGNATSATNATNASNTDILNEVASTTLHYPTFVSGTSGNLPQLVSNPGLNYVPSTGTLTATRFSGPLTGNATSANNALTTTITNDNATGTVSYPTFVTASSGNLGQRTADARLTFVPSTGNLTATTFTSTVPTGAAPLVVASNTTVANLSATNTLNTNITDDVATAAPVYPTFVTATAGYQNQRTASSRLSFVPSTGILTATGFTGTLTGNATTATSTALTAITDDISTAVPTYPTFVTGTTGNLGHNTSSSRLSFVPSTGVLTANSFASTVATGTAPFTVASSTPVANLTSTNARFTEISDDVLTATTVYPTFVNGITGNLNQRTASSRLTFTPSTGVLTATGGFVGSLNGNATTATNAANAGISASSAVTEDATSITESYPVFVGVTPGNQPLRTTATANRLTFQPSTGRLTAGSFRGPLIGNVTGNATSADDAQNTVNIRVSPSNLNSPFYPTFVSGTTGPLPPFTNLGLSFTPQTGELLAPVFRGALIGNASTATTVSGNVAAINGGTGQSSYNTGDLLYASSSIALSRLSALGMGGRVLRVNTVTGLPAWELAGAGTVQSVTGTANRIVIANNDPTVNPTVDISPTYAGQNTITTLGNVTTGTWNGTEISVSRGGTGLPSLPNNVLVGNGTGAITIPAGASNVGFVLTSTGASTAPTYQAAAAGDMLLAGTQLNTGVKTFSDGSLILRGSGSGLTTLAANGTANGVITLPGGNLTLASLTGAETMSNKSFTGPTNFSGTTTLATADIATLNVSGTATASSFVGPLTGNATTSTNTSNVGLRSAATVVSGVDLANNATDLNIALQIVKRDGANNFTAGTITATLNGNANNVNGTVAIANGGTGATTKTTGFNALSPMTTVGDIIYGGVAGTGTRLPVGGANTFLKSGAAPTWSAVTLTTDVTGILPGVNGGTGLNNGTNTISVGGNFSTSAALNILTGSTTINFGPNPGSGAVETQTFAVIGAIVGDVVSLGVEDTVMGNGAVYSAWVSAAGTVSVRFTNASAVGIDPPQAIFKVKIFQ